MTRSERHSPMKPVPFDHVAPRTLEEALALLAEHGEDAKVLAGGQSLVPILALRLAARLKIGRRSLGSVSTYCRCGTAASTFCSTQSP